jgi:hypothetical protein
MHEFAHTVGLRLAHQIDTIMEDAVKRRLRTDFLVPGELDGRLTRIGFTAPNTPVTYCLDGIPLVTLEQPSITHVCDKGSYSIVTKLSYRLHP